MSASPMPDQSNPQAAAPSGAPSQGSPQANPLQQVLGQLVMAVRQIGTQNTIIQPEMQQISQTLVQALQKVSQAGSGPAQPLSAPPQQ
jgi:hypothetical protein